jgi:hypothetical protein
LERLNQRTKKRQVHKWSLCSLALIDQRCRVSTTSNRQGLADSLSIKLLIIEQQLFGFSSTGQARSAALGAVVFIQHSG